MNYNQSKFKRLVRGLAVSKNVFNKKLREKDEQIQELSKDKERLDFLLNYITSYEVAGGQRLFWQACQYDTREEIDEFMERINEEEGDYKTLDNS